MALKPVPIDPVEAHRLDDPRRPAVIRDDPRPQSDAARDSVAKPAPRREPRATDRRKANTSAQQSAPSDRRATTAGLVNPYARARPHQVAVSLYVPQWERIEEQCADLRAQGVRDATLTRWLFAVLHFRAPTDVDAGGQLLRRWAREEADDNSPYFGLRKEARGVRFYEALWEGQRALVTTLRRGAGPGRPTMATWVSAIVGLLGPTTAADARELLRELRILLAGDPG